MLYSTAITWYKVHCTLSLHQVVGNLSHYCHVAAERVDRLIRKVEPHLERRFIQTWSNLVSRIKI